jgi:myo-inositol-1(or 4)-monophosphatase
MTTKEPTLQQVIQWAKEAGAIAREGFHQEHAIQMKGALDLATEIDHACEKVLMDHIKAEFPAHAIVAEESGKTNDNPDHCWYIDPLDGTINYSHRLPIYAVSVAYAQQGKLTLGVVYDPSRDECFSAELGKGAWLNGEPIHVSGCGALQKAILATGLPSNNEARLDRNLGLVRYMNLHTQGVRRLGSVAISLCYVASGRMDGHWDLGSTAWDLAASALIVSEAGGVITTISGESDYFRHPFGFLAAPPGIHKALLNVLNK